MIRSTSKEIKKYKRTLFGGEDRDWWDSDQDYELACDVCEKTKKFNINRHSYHGWSGSGWLFWDVSMYGFSSCDYGKHNRRKIHFCKDHRDSEIEAKIMELA